MTEIALLTDRGARIAWATALEPAADVPGTAALAGPFVAAWAAIRELGHVEALTRARAGVLAVGEAVAERARRADVERQEEMAAALGARILTPADAEWPTGVDDLVTPPHCVWVRGDVDLAEAMRRSASVVGSRAATAYGLDVTRDIAVGLADRGFTVTSGAAFGIDGAAHEGALAGGGTTVALLACGIDRVYPAAHAHLLAEIARTGAVVTELPPGSLPLRQRFLSRNRLIAALTRGTLVVEAGLRSGSLNTARHARALGRPVGAVPGPVTSPVSAGCHALLRNTDAALVTSAAEAVDLFGDIGPDTADTIHVDDIDQRWSDADRTVFGVIPVRAAVGLDTLVDGTGLPVADVLATLTRLEEDAVIRRRGDGWQKTPTGLRA